MLIHADADAFFASVEARDDPALAGRAFVVAAHVVTCASYPARARGIHAGMPLAAARRLDRELIVISPRPQAYDAASADLFALFASYTVFVEPGSMEEAFLDVEVVGLDPVATAKTLRARARAELGLPVSMGIGTTKLMAKVASRRAKPDGLLMISRGADRAIRHALTFEEVWGIGPTKVAALRSQGWVRVGDLAGAAVEDLVPIVGTMTARKVAAICAGLDDAAIRVPGERRSAAASRTIAATRSRSTIEALCADLLSTAIARLPPRVEITRVDLAVRFDDGALVSITRPLRPPVTDLDHLPSQVASGLADTAYEQDGRGVGFVSVGLVCRPRTGDPTQLSLF